MEAKLQAAVAQKVIHHPVGFEKGQARRGKVLRGTSPRRL